jgi:hypothetical protein
LQNSIVDPTIGYNDTELRNRIIGLEDNQIPKAHVFNKDIDLVSESLLDSSLRDKINQIKDNKNDIEYLKGKAVDEDQLRHVTDKIEENDLSDSLISKIDRSYAYYQSVIPDGESVMIDDPAAIMIILGNLQNSKADRAALSEYRRKDVPISINDFTNVIAENIQKIPELESALQDKANTSDLFNYRDKNTKIYASDIDTEVMNKINEAVDFANNTDEAISTAVRAESENTISKVVNETIGNRYGILPMEYQRQVLALTSAAGDTSPESDSYVLTTLLYWMINDGIGDKYGKMPEELQEKICKYVESPNTSASDNTYYGLKYGYFSLTDAVMYLSNEIETLKEKIEELTTEENAEEPATGE